MKRIMAFLGMTVFLFLLSLGVNMAQDKPLQFNRPEMESMMFLFNETTIKGSDIDVLAALSQKLKAGVQESAAFSDTTQTVSLPLTAQEAQVCLNIINNATFQARFVELVLGMKQKLQLLAPSQPSPFQAN